VRCADGPAPRRRRFVIWRTSSTTPIALKPHGRSSPHRWTVRAAPAGGPPSTVGQSGPLCGQSVLPPLFLFQLDIFRDKDLNMNLLRSLLKNNEGILPYDVM
jgi:hypothetical protein